MIRRTTKKDQMSGFYSVLDYRAKEIYQQRKSLKIENIRKILDIEEGEYLYDDFCQDEKFDMDVEFLTKISQDYRIMAEITNISLNFARCLFLKFLKNGIDNEVVLEFFRFMLASIDKEILFNNSFQKEIEIIEVKGEKFPFFEEFSYNEETFFNYLLEYTYLSENPEYFYIMKEYMKENQDVKINLISVFFDDNENLQLYVAQNFASNVSIEKMFRFIKAYQRPLNYQIAVFTPEDLFLLLRVLRRIILTEWFKNINKDDLEIIFFVLSLYSNIQVLFQQNQLFWTLDRIFKIDDDLDFLLRILPIAIESSKINLVEIYVKYFQNIPKDTNRYIIKINEFLIDYATLEELNTVEDAFYYNLEERMIKIKEIYERIEKLEDDLSKGKIDPEIASSEKQLLEKEIENLNRTGLVDRILGRVLYEENKLNLNKYD